jgi:uncharacterized protein YndB with AHSA1/START domain
MISLRTSVHIAGIHAGDVFDFMLNPSDHQYQQWWPGIHVQFHYLEQRSGYIGSRIYMDEFVGRRRLRMNGTVSEVVPGKRIVWRLRALLPLPARLSLDLTDDSSGVVITHTTQAGFSGVGAMLDPLIRLYFSDSFARELDRHVRAEFARLGAMLSSSNPGYGTAVQSAAWAEVPHR